MRPIDQLPHKVEVTPPLTEVEKLERAFYAQRQLKRARAPILTRPVWTTATYWKLLPSRIKSAFRIGRRTIEDEEFQDEFTKLTKR